MSWARLLHSGISFLRDKLVLKSFNSVGDSQIRGCGERTLSFIKINRLENYTEEKSLTQTVYINPIIYSCSFTRIQRTVDTSMTMINPHTE